MKISYDEAKRAATFAERGLDFADAPAVFASEVITVVDDRFDYGEERLASYGFLNERLVAIVWSERAGVRRIISMRHAHHKELDRVRTARSQ